MQHNNEQTSTVTWLKAFVTVSFKTDLVDTWSAVESFYNHCGTWKVKVVNCDLIAGSGLQLLYGLFFSGVSGVPAQNTWRKSSGEMKWSRSYLCYYFSLFMPLSTLHFRGKHNIFYFTTFIRKHAKSLRNRFCYELLKVETRTAEMILWVINELLTSSAFSFNLKIDGEAILK